VAEYSFKRGQNIQVQDSTILSNESRFTYCIITEPMRFTSTTIPQRRKLAHLQQVMETSYSRPEEMKKASL
jgi:hypothetical protein